MCVYVHVLFNCTISLKSSQWVVSGLPPFGFIPDKKIIIIVFLFYCWRNNIIEAQLRGLQHLRNAVPGLSDHGNASFDAICHPVASLWRICQSMAGFAPCLDRAHLSCWCDIHSSGLNPALRASSLWHIGAKWKHQQVIRNSEWIKWNLSQWREKHRVFSLCLCVCVCVSVHFLWFEHALALFPADLIQK